MGFGPGAKILRSRTWDEGFWRRNHQSFLKVTFKKRNSMKHSQGLPGVRRKES